MVLVINKEYEQWVNDNVVPACADLGIKVTKSALTLFSYALQAQIEDKTVSSKQEIFVRAHKFSETFLGVYQKRFQDEELNFNRAMRLLVESNTRLRMFPYGDPSD